MIRTTTVVVLTLLANLADAYRVNRYRVTVDNEDESEAKVQFPFGGRSCEDLQGIFRNRVTAVQKILDTQHNATHVGAMLQAKTIMRVFGVVKTFRRAKDCEWVIDGSGEDVALAKSVLQAVLAEHPCAQAALAEMSPEAFEAAENEILPLQRAMIVMMSESCEVQEPEEEEVAVLEDEDAVEYDLNEKEAEVQDHIDELFEQATVESEIAATPYLSGSFVEGASTFGLGRVLQILGAVFLGVLFGLLCAGPGLLIGAILGFFLCVLGPRGMCGRPVAGNGQVLNGLAIGGLLGGAVGFGACARATIHELAMN